MTLSPGVRKFTLTAHVTFSVGWFGSVAGFLALAIAGLTSQDAQMVRASYLAMELITWFVIVPLAVASLLTGFVVSLGTEWGLFRHYWVLAKLIITILATILLLVHTRPIGVLSNVARDPVASFDDVNRLQFQVVGDAALAALALLAATVLGIYKPWGMTDYGRRQLRRPVDAVGGLVSSTPRWVYLAGIIGSVLVLLFVMLHLTGNGLSHH